MALNIKLDRDSGPNDGRTNDLGLIGRASNDSDTVFIRVKDMATGIVSRVEVATDATGKFSFTPAGGDDGRYMIRVFDPTTGERDHVRVQLDTDADVNGRAVELKADATVADVANVSYTMRGLDNDAKAKITFTDADGDTITRTVNANGDFTVNLSSLSAGPITSTVTIIDESTNSTVVTGAEVVICFYAGTRIATPTGQSAVETLAAGDLVMTADGEARPVLWVGRQTVSTRFGDAARVLPIRIAAGALAEGVPARDLLVSPDHALLLDGVLVQASALVNGTTIRRDGAVPEVFTYYHVELADHALILAEGVPAETFIDNAGRLAFDNWHDRVATQPTVELPLPRAKSQRQVPASARARLADRAAMLRDDVAAAA